MDYSLAALKLLCAQLKDATETASQNSMTLGGILFQRAWLQVPKTPFPFSFQ
jgi:RecQ-mediated genome instability protein 2